ncbi:hypothetical protein GCM10023155_03610 [Bremerella cremea]
MIVGVVFLQHAARIDTQAIYKHRWSSRLEAAFIYLFLCFVPNLSVPVRGTDFLSPGYYY